MTHPKQELTPGDVVFDLCHRTNTSYGVSRSLAHELAAAAIEAFLKKQSKFVDNPHADCGGLCETPPTENKDEREHCADVAETTPLGKVWMTADAVHALRDLLLRERAAAYNAGKRAGKWESNVELTEALDRGAAADKAGYERGFNARNEIKDKAIDALEQEIISFGSPPWMYSKLKIETDAQLAALQSQHKRLTAAARDIGNDEVDQGAAREHLAMVLRTAALAETEEKKT